MAKGSGGAAGGNGQLSPLRWSGLGVPEVRFPLPSFSYARAALAAAPDSALGLPRPHPAALGWQGWGRPWVPASPRLPSRTLGLLPPGGGTGGSGQCPASREGLPRAASPPNTRLLPRHAALCGLRLGRPASGTEGEPRRQPSRSFLNLAGSFTNKRKEYSERRIIG